MRIAVIGIVTRALPARRIAPLPIYTCSTDRDDLDGASTLISPVMRGGFSIVDPHVSSSSVLIYSLWSREGPAAAFSCACELCLMP